MEIYHETAGSAMREAQKTADEARAVFTDERPDTEMISGGVSYGQTRDFHFQLNSYKGKGTRKWFHVSLYRMDSGRYELNCYVL